MSPRYVIVYLLLSFAVTSPVWTQISLSARRPNTRDVLKPLELKSLQADIRIEEDIAVTKLDQVFYNPTSERLEGVYSFQLPEGSVVRELALWINGQRVQGQIEERKKATYVYEGIVRKMEDPALLNVTGNRFSLRIFPIEPRSERRIEITYVSMVPRPDSSGFLYKLPVLGPPDLPIGRIAVSVETSFNYMGGGSWESTRNLRLSGRDGFLPWMIAGSIAPRRLIHAHEFSQVSLRKHRIATTLALPIGK